MTTSKSDLEFDGWTLVYDGSVSVWRKGQSYGLLANGSSFSPIGATSAAAALRAKVVLLAALHMGGEVEGSELQATLGMLD